MAKIKKNKKKKGKKKRGCKSLADMDFSNVNLPSLNIDFNTGGGTSFFDDKLTALSELQSKLTPSVMQKKLDALIDVKKGKTSYVNSEIMNKVFLGTAHPGKFSDVVEPIIGKSIDLPKRLERVLSL